MRKTGVLTGAGNWKKCRLKKESSYHGGKSAGSWNAGGRKAHTHAKSTKLTVHNTAKLPYRICLTEVRRSDPCKGWAKAAVICILSDLHSREVIGYSSGAHRDAHSVRAAFAEVRGNPAQIQMFHTNRGSGSDNYLIDDLPGTSGINRSLCLKGTPLLPEPLSSEPVINSGS